MLDSQPLKLEPYRYLSSVDGDAMAFGFVETREAARNQVLVY